METRSRRLAFSLAVPIACLLVVFACGDPPAKPVLQPAAEAAPTVTPASGPTPLPTPKATSTPTAVSIAPSADVSPSADGIEGLLSGDTLARYRALPPAFQAALDTYAWFGVPPDLIPLAARDKMDQWGDAAVPLAEILDEGRAERFLDPENHSSSVFSNHLEVRHAGLLLSGYVYLLAMEPSAERRLQVMRQLANVPMPPSDWLTPESDGSVPSVDPASDSLIWLAPPPPDAVLTKTALARLEQLGPRLRQGLFDFERTANEGWRDSRDMAEWLTFLEMFLLKVEPGLELPLIEAYLSADSLVAFKALSQERRDLAVASFEGGVIVAYVHYIAVQGSVEIPLGTFGLEGFGLLGHQLGESAEWAVDWVRR